MEGVSELVGNVIETDVLVIGSGGAGCTAAIEAARNGVKATIVTKGKIAHCGITPIAGGALTCDGKGLYELGLGGDPKDSQKKYFNDIVEGGLYLANQKMVEVFLRDCKARIKDLIDWGMVRWGADSLHLTGRRLHSTGRSIADALANGVKKHNVEVISDVTVAELITQRGRVVGAVGINIYTGEIITFKSKAVVLATGGWHQLYSFNSGTTDITGDGQAMAYRAGAELTNMEMVQFCHYVILWPPRHRGKDGLAYPLSVGVGQVVDKNGNKLFQGYEEVDHEDKSAFAIAEMKTIATGKGSIHGGVYWNIKGVKEHELKKFGMKARWKDKKDSVDLIERLKAGESIEVGPAAHYFIGGIKVNEKGECTIPGLYAAGECTSGLQGANRRDAAATSEMLVQGAVAGKSAAEYAKKIETPTIETKTIENIRSKLLEPLQRKEGVNPVEIKKKIRKICDKALGVLRTEEQLQKACQEIDRIKEEDLPKIYVPTKSRAYNKEWIDALQVKNMIQVLEASARSALMRTESRGSHYRLDYPDADNDNWLKEITVKQVVEKMELTTQPVVVTSYELPKGKMTFTEVLRSKGVKI